MKQFSNYDDAKKQAKSSGMKRLPAGAYVCKIIGVKYEAGENGYSDRINLQFDIVEGDFKDYFHEQYETNTNEDKKYKGKVTVYVPKDDGTTEDGWTKKTFAGWTNAFEESNPGYSWDWNEKKWKDKLVGIVFGETGTVINGKEIVYTEARFAVSADSVRQGVAPAAKFKAKNGYTGNSSSASGSSSSDGFIDVPLDAMDELPFN